MAIVEVVKYNGAPDVFAWKYPEQELGTWTQLIVNESQEAVLFKGGKAFDVFTGGRHTLETANIPLLNKIINLPFGGRSPFTAEIWYVSKASSLDIKWGTASPIQLQDPKYLIFVQLTAYGQFGIRINDSRRFLTKLVGTLPVFDKENIVKYFRGLYLTKAKDAISSYLIHRQISIMEINAYLDELSGFLKEQLAPVLAEYGILIESFYVNDISVPESDTAAKQLKEALAKKAEMDIIGYNYQQERSFDTLEGAAKNSGGAAADLMGAGIGLGMGGILGGAVGSQMGDIAQNIKTDSEKTVPCPNCGAEMAKNKRFCADCGFDTAEIRADICEICGAQLPSPKAKFCPECGAAVGRQCPKCGIRLNKNANFCPECGTRLTQETKPDTSAPINEDTEHGGENNV